MNYLIDAEGNTTPTGNTLAELDAWATAKHAFMNANALRDTIGPITVSTVFLGSNPRHGAGCPLLFETMVEHEDDIGGAIIDRHATWDEAQAHHAHTVAQCSAPSGADIIDAAARGYGI